MIPIDRERTRSGARFDGALADRLPHDHRLWCAEQGGSEKCHGSPLGAEEIKARACGAGLDRKPAFSIPDDVREIWRSAGRAGKAARLAWSDRLRGMPPPAVWSSRAGCAASCRVAGSPPRCAP